MHWDNYCQKCQFITAFRKFYSQFDIITVINCFVILKYGGWLYFVYIPLCVIGDKNITLLSLMRKYIIYLKPEIIHFQNASSKLKSVNGHIMIFFQANIPLEIFVIIFIWKSFNLQEIHWNWENRKLVALHSKIFMLLLQKKILLF